MPRGREVKKGTKGKAALFMSRDRALFKLQLTLRDFRKLCILKGIYPRVPPNTIKKKNKTYYHTKDIQFLMHDPIISSIRDYKTYRKKLRKFHARHEHSRAKSLKKSKPEFNFDHMIKERYPTFSEALKDMDDALTMVYLFATLPQNRFLKHWVIDRCIKLSNEWTSYVVRSRSLKKVFCSIKGIYYQASVMGETCTWMIPYPYTPNVPENVDFKVMITFLEFHMKHLEFVMFRLYAQLGLSYPPIFNAALAGAGATVTAYQFKDINAIEKAPHAADDDDADLDDDEDMNNNGKNDDNDDDEEDDIQNEEQARQIQAQVGEIALKLRELGMDAEQFEEPINEADLQNDLLDQAGEEFRRLAQLEGEDVGVAGVDPLPILFRGLVFFIGRENLRDALYMALAACGAAVGWDGPDSPFGADHESITHIVCDRPSLNAPRVDCEYVQPQWVFDSINFAFLLPVQEYAPGVSLPPHLSPFVDDAAEGYVPERKKQILRYIEERKGNVVAMDDDNDNELDEGQLHPVDAEELYQEGLQVETGKLAKDKQNAMERAKSRRREREQESVREVEEEKKLASGILSRKKRRLYDRIQYTKTKKETRAEKLKQKAADFRQNVTK